MLNVKILFAATLAVVAPALVASPGLARSVNLQIGNTRRSQSYHHHYSGDRYGVQGVLLDSKGLSVQLQLGDSIPLHGHSRRFTGNPLNGHPINGHPLNGHRRSRIHHVPSRHRHYDVPHKVIIRDRRRSSRHRNSVEYEVDSYGNLRYHRRHGHHRNNSVDAYGHVYRSHSRRSRIYRSPVPWNAQ